MSPENVVVVAVRAEREISKTALEWALTHVVRPGDLVTLLAVLSDHGPRGGWRRRLLPWGFPRFGGGGGSGSRRHRERCQISAACSQMALQIDGRNEIAVRIKVVGSESSSGAASSSAGEGVVATESKSVGANWIVLDKESLPYRLLKQEIRHCMEELQCNVVVMRGSCANVLRLNLGGAYEPVPPFSSSCSPNCSEKFLSNGVGQLKPISICDDVKASVYKEITEAGSSTGIGRASSIFVDEENPPFEGIYNRKLEDDAGTSDSESSGVASPPSFPLGLDLIQDEARRESSSGFHPQPRSYPAAAFSVTAHNRGVYWIPQNHIAEENAFIQRCKTDNTRPPPPSAKTLQEMFAESNRGYAIGKAGLHPELAEDHTYGSDVREAVSLIGSSPSIPPPLCSLCRHKAPVFGKPPRRFAYRELEMATDGFSNENFVADGAIGCVHRGVLEDGRVVAVKRLKPAGSDVRGEDEFCEEVEVLSRAQHRNVVMLVGFCVEGKRRLLVYEYICNGSLDRHLYGRKKAPLDWHARIKIAVGVARGLRYLHEDCRVGFVVHKDMRPNNILLTHDYEPLVGDFSLSRWQTESCPPADANVAETFGYLAPEYIEHGVVTEKADVYAYGVVLLEMITGRRALDARQPKGQQFLVEWARPLLSLASDEGRTIAVDRFLDPRPDWDQARFFSRQLRSMARAASMCLRRDPQARPGMSKVLRILEGDAVVDHVFDIHSVGTRSGRMSCPILHQDSAMGGSVSQRFARERVIHSLHDQRSWPRFR
uniref:non-specific serine/threonine protein kinase n=1 Tax=Elaeis guineensis var. tenera TaxID=51953 RepID=A0A6I9QDH7_ELAGV|nr:inactive protein kinase SELMODRAFT_444075 isoform X1 [Elaeis guineensis]